MKRITDATKSIKRTLAWFIEVLAGCTFQTLSEKGTFKNCFGSNRYSHNGFIDFSNLNVIRNISSFNWNFENLYQLQIEFSEIVSSHHQLLKIEPIINELSDAVKNAPNNQLIYMDSELEKLVQSIDQTISPSFSAAYLQLIEKYYDYFVNRN